MIVCLNLEDMTGEHIDRLNATFVAFYYRVEKQLATTGNIYIRCSGKLNADIIKTVSMKKNVFYAPRRNKFGFRRRKTQAGEILS